MKNKIGIITYFNIDNYGSSLQAFALSKIVSEKGYFIEFLNVKEEAAISKILHKAYVFLVMMIKQILNKEAREVNKEIKTLKDNSNKNISDSVHEKFELFRRQSFNCITIGRLKLKHLAKKDYICFICGSDQIWSPLSLHLSGYKFLNFAPRGKRIAYAPSFGVNRIPSYNKKRIGKLIKRIDYLSIREEHGKKIIERDYGMDAQVVCDPTLLITASEWRTLYEGCTNLMIGEPYAILYFFEKPELSIISSIKDYCKKNNIHPISFFDLGDNEIELVEASPMEFLKIIDQSKCVFTSSFHGCVFSIVFNKRFCVFQRKHSQNVKQSSRIESLLTRLDLNIECKNNSDFNFINCDNCLDKLNDFRNYSLNYLFTSLQKAANE